MEKRSILILCKISLLIVLLIFFDFFSIVIVNNFIDEKQFDSDFSGVYLYEDIFRQIENEDVYYISRAYFNNQTELFGNECKYDFAYKILKNAKFKSVPPAVASIIKSYVSSKSVIGYCCLNGGEIEEVPAKYNAKNLVNTDKSFITWADFYCISDKVYMLARFNDSDIEIDVESTLHYTVNRMTVESKTIAMFEVENVDLEQLKIGDEQKTFYDKPFKNLLERPYSYITLAVLLLESLIVISIGVDRGRFSVLPDDGTMIDKK